MIIKIENYDIGRRVVSLAFSKETENKLKVRHLDGMTVLSKSIYFWKDNMELKVSKDTLRQLNQCQDYDVFQIDENGNAYLFFNNESLDNAFMLAGKCNSSCIMCPAADVIRKKAKTEDMEEIKSIVKHLPMDARHITITGGEPFLVGDEIFKFFELLKENSPRTSYLLLTNGRAFAIPGYVEKLTNTLPYNTIIGIPLHGSNENMHDAITRAPGSFKQTVTGLTNLLKYNHNVELRLVVSKLNLNCITDIAGLIANKFKSVNSVKIMGMEMTGNAALNKNKLWIPYEKAFQASKDAIDLLIRNAIDVALYNFPLCSVEENYRMLCKKSITDYKVRYADLCDYCQAKDACGGIFTGSFKLAEQDIKPMVDKHDKFF